MWKEAGVKPLINDEEMWSGCIDHRWRYFTCKACQDRLGDYTFLKPLPDESPMERLKRFHKIKMDRL